MENIQNKTPEEEKKEKLYSQKDFDDYKAKIEQEFLQKESEMKQEVEKENKKANMSELDLAKAELEEYKQKYQAKEDECLITKQKEEALNLVKGAELDPMVLDIVYVPKDLNKTKERIEILKGYIEKIKKDIFKGYSNSPVPPTSKETPQYDAFIEGFDTNRL